jgi:hypothetical protein
LRGRDIVALTLHESVSVLAPVSVAASTPESAGLPESIVAG